MLIISSGVRMTCPPKWWTILLYVVTGKFVNFAKSTLNLFISLLLGIILVFAFGYFLFAFCACVCVHCNDSGLCDCSCRRSVQNKKPHDIEAQRVTQQPSSSTRMQFDFIAPPAYSESNKFGTGLAIPVRMILICLLVS